MAVVEMIGITYTKSCNCMKTMIEKELANTKKPYSSKKKSAKVWIIQQRNIQSKLTKNTEANAGSGKVRLTIKTVWITCIEIFTK